MQITLLGTGPSKRIPRPNCGKWYVCKEARRPGSKSARLQTSTFFEFSGSNILVDVSQDFKKQSIPIKNKNINKIFLTHGHIDAAGGLKDLYGYGRKFGLPVVCTEQNTKQVLIEQNLWADFPFFEIGPFKELAEKNLKIIPFRVEHSFDSRFLTLGYLFFDGKKKIAYASDFKKMPIKSKKLIKRADLAILDCAAYKNPIPTHQSFPEILKLAKELKFKKVYLTQVGIAWPHYELAQKIVARQAKNIFLAYDGLEVKV